MLNCRGDWTRLPAFRAVHAQEAVRQHAAAKGGPKLLLDEAGGWRVLQPRASQEGLERFANDPVHGGASALGLEAAAKEGPVPQTDLVDEDAQGPAVASNTA